MDQLHGRVTAKLYLINKSDRRVRLPLRFVVSRFSSAMGTLPQRFVSATPRHPLCLTFSDAAGKSVLEPGAAAGPVSLKFTVSNLRRPSYALLSTLKSPTDILDVLARYLVIEGVVSH